jgi:hypothetical protein
MRYSNNYLQSHDIDWFCVINGIPVHFASAGSLLPYWANNKEVLRSVQRFVNTLPIVVDDDIEIDSSLKERFTKDELADYLQTFEDMARKGFISYDKANIGDGESSIYRFVCGPKVPFNDNKLLMEAMKSVCHVEFTAFDYIYPISQIDVIRDLKLV